AMISSQLIGEVLGSVVGGPVGTVVGSASGSIVTRVFGGAGVDAARQERANWTLQMAINGSILAAEIIIAAPANVSNNEAGMWRDALSHVPANVLAAANDATGGLGWWPSGQPDFYTDTNGPTHRTILAQVQAAGASVPTLPPPTTLATTTAVGNVPPPQTSGGSAQQLPTVNVTAPRSTASLALYIGGGLVLLLL